MIHIIQRSVTFLQLNVTYSFIIALLALGSLAMLSYEFFPNADLERISLFQKIDIGIAIIFLTDFFAGLAFNTSVNRKKFFKQNWLNLISSIPVTSDITRALRILRIFRAFRVIRAGMNFWFARSRLKRNRTSR